jgi:lactate permease
LEYLQNYNPTGAVWFSTLAAGAPVITLLYLLAVHPTKRSDGSLHKGIAAHWAAIGAVIVAVSLAVFVFKMPVKSTGMSFVYGVMFGLFPIGWIVISAMFLYTITLTNGTFETVKNSVARLSSDSRVQAILIAFSFGAFVEGAAGFGTPVAISGALMVGLGFRPREAAILCLIANTAPVAYGALGTPITALEAVTGIKAELISKMAARQLPFFSLIVPVWMTAVQVRMEGRSWRAVREVWPALAVAGGSFAATQFVVGNYFDYHLVDIAGGVVSMGAVALLCKVWKPKERDEATERRSDEVKGKVPSSGFEVPGEDAGKVWFAWLPWAMLVVLVFLWGYGPVKDKLEGFKGAVIKWNVPAVHGVVYRTPPVVKEKTIDKAEYKFNWLSAPGTGIFIAAIFAGIISGMSADMWRTAILRTIARLRLPLLTIALVLGMSYVTKYSGMDAVLGLAFTKTGAIYPFFAAMLGWLGVALTGSDTASNVMFGSMQKITAEQAGFNPLLIVTANSTGGVMGKMIDAQSIVVATAACYENKEEGKMEAGPIFRGVLVHSVVLAMLMGVLVMLQAYWLKWMVPH